MTTGILAVLFSLLFLVWATLFVQRKNGGLVLILLSVVMLLVGGGFGPPVLGIIVGVIGTRIHASSNWWRPELPIGSRHFLGRLWPWSFIAGLIAWLLLLPGANILDYFFSANNPNLIFAFILSAFGFLALTIITGFARDRQKPI